MTTDLRHTKVTQPSCSSNTVIASRQQEPLAARSVGDESQEQYYQTLRRRPARCASMSAFSRPSHFFSVLLQFVLFAACCFVFTHAQVQFSSNEDKRNNFEREFLSFGKRAAVPIDLMERNFMSFGKRASDSFGHQFMPFGKRYMSLADVLAVNSAASNEPVIGIYQKKPLLEKRAPETEFQRDFMAFGKRK